MTGGERHELLSASAAAFARVALRNVGREFPHHEPLLEIDAEPVGRPRDRHPAFYGSYDWHSCVEMHWVLVRLLRAVPEHVPAAEIRTVLDAHLTAGALAAEARWFADPNRRAAERPYGWAGRSRSRRSSAPGGMRTPPAGRGASNRSRTCWSTGSWNGSRS